MSERWFFVDGRLERLTGDHEDILDRARELRADGHTVKDAPRPKPITPRTMARAASHRRRRR